MSTPNVLAYNAINTQNIALRRSAAALDSSISVLNSQCSTAITNITTFGTGIVGNAGPNQSHIWCTIPEGSGWTAGFKVCNTATQFNCGFCCAWTVPGGVTCARFQVWGAGGQAGSGMCCSGSPFGGTGAYASVIMPVSAGWTYTLCAGCALCCFVNPCFQGNASGCSSWVSGCNLTNFCAEGGEGSLYCYARTHGSIGANTYSCCAILGLSICNTGSSFCAAPWISFGGRGCTTCNPTVPTCNITFGVIQLPTIASCKTYFGSAVGGTVYGIRGGLPGMVVDSNMYGYYVHPPIYGFPDACTCFIFNNGNTCGGFECNASCGFLRYPGAGGYGSIAFGGCVGKCGDMGRMGMVCVSYK